jgi:imidazolonepropionase-like amidohydrolase
MKIFASQILLGQKLELMRDQIITVEQSKITSIVSGKSAEADILIQGNKTVLPGLIDCHSHLALDARIFGHLDMMEDCEAKQTIRALVSLKDNLRAGITGMRSLGDRYYLDILLRNMIQEKNLEGPWLHVAGIGMKGFHGHGYVGKGFSGVEEFRRQSRENLFRGVDWLKIFITPGAPPKTGNVPVFLSREEVRVVVQEAHAVGKRVSSHCIGGTALQYCCEEDVDCLEHCYWVENNDIDTIIKHDTQVCFTPSVFLDESRLPMCPSSHVEAVKRTSNEVRRRLENLVKAKPRFVIGSDANHGLLWKDFELMIELGMDRVEALKGITVYAAKMLGLEGVVGSIQKGSKADLIAVEGNPLIERNVLGKVGFVMQGGNVIINTFTK